MIDAADSGAISGPPGLAFRPITPDDTEFLYAVYASTRTEEMALLDWADAEKETFLRSQFKAQHQAYQDTYPGDEFLVILLSGRPVGRLYVGRWKEEIRIIDIALLPECRNGGIGSTILGDILAEAARTDQRVTIHVEMFNPALRLYRRLGFVPRGEHGVYHFMEWSPPPSP